MRVVIIWREQSEYGQQVREFLHELARRSGGRQPESYDPDELAGESFCRAYDITNYPAILALDNDGRVLQEWRGELLPKVDDVVYYCLGA